MANKKIIFSGIQPSGDLHIGNLLGMIEPAVNLQTAGNDLILMLADLHAITVPQNPEILRRNSLDLTAWFLTVGLDPKKSHLFIQSENPDHPYLTWIFNCITGMNQLERMTQFKDKSKKQGRSTSIGLFSYPVLQAVDILLYDPDLVPVGEDQVQHVELTRDIADKFNRTFGETFKLPKAMIDKQAARVMSLQNPESKMSKSDIDPRGTINLLDSPEEIEKKIKTAITDSGGEIVYDKNKQAINNLMNIYSGFSNMTMPQIEEKYRGQGYAVFKKDLADILVQGLKPIQEKYHKLRHDEDTLKKILSDGRDYAISKSSPKIERVRQLVGFI